MPKVSVIVPNYNHAPFLQERMESILNQIYQDFEVIILDDCSTDNSREIIESYRTHPKISKIIYNDINSGNTFVQWNKGIEQARGEWIWIAESDDWCELNFLNTIFNKVQKVEQEKNYNISLAYSNSYISDEFNNLNGIYDENFALYQNDFYLEGKELIQKYFPYLNIIPNASAVIFRKKLITSIVINDLLHFKINGDWFLWINLLLNGNCLFISEPLNYFRRHYGASSSKNVLNFKNIEEAIRINVFLEKKGFNIVNKKYWLKFWLNQANFNLKKILKTNFFSIYIQAIKIYPFSFSYLIFKILKRKFKFLFS
ncbi:MAG TPA: glycosyltransferase [Paludibacteraceae bacterium]|nr:glycosyltransferase [Paludibacteraceae bacterium]